MKVPVLVENPRLRDTRDSCPDEIDILLAQGLEIPWSGRQPSTARRERWFQRLVDPRFRLEFLAHVQVGHVPEESLDVRARERRDLGFVHDRLDVVPVHEVLGRVGGEVLALGGWVFG